MERANSLFAQNVIGRITHGLVGFDLFLEEGKDNDYLKDFLTLSDKDLENALLSAPLQVRCISATSISLQPEHRDLIETVKQAQIVAKKIREVDPKRDIEPMIQKLGSKLDIIYRSVKH